MKKFMALLQSLQLPMGSNIIHFELQATDGNTYSPANFADKKILVIIFMCNHCPYVKGIIDELIQIQSDYADEAVQLIGINSNDTNEYPEDSFEAMQEWAKEKGINFVYLHDETQEVAKAYKAQCTPDIYVYDTAWKLAYHGRLNDNWQNPEAVTEHSVRNALDAILNEKEVNPDQKPSMGCSIKWKD